MSKETQPKVETGITTEQEVTKKPLEVFIEKQEAAFGGNSLSKTNELTTIAKHIAVAALNAINEQSEDELVQGKFMAALQDHGQMDELLEPYIVVSESALDFLKGVSDDEAEKMIRSQQSKRSRAKAKQPQTREVILTNMEGAVSEALLRRVFNKPKSSGAYGNYSELLYTDEKIADFKNDPEALKKELRNIQSKKSILKSKEENYKELVRWQQLVDAEEMLKRLRDNGTATLSEEDKQALAAREKAAELLQDIQVQDLSEEDAKDLMEKLKETLLGQ